MTFGGFTINVDVNAFDNKQEIIDHVLILLKELLMQHSLECLVGILNEKWKDCENLILKYKLSGNVTVVGSYQILFAMQQDGIVITNQVTPMLNEYRLTTACLSMCSVFDNQINFHTWDSDNYSSYITPFRLNSRKVNTQPYMIDMIDSSMYMDYRSISSLQKYMHLYMVYLQCYPEMMEISK